MATMTKAKTGKALEIISSNMVEIAEHEAAMNADIMLAKKRFEKQTKHLKDQNKELFARVEAYAQDARQELFGKSKSASFPGGSVGFRVSSSLDLVGDGNWDDVLQHCIDLEEEDLIVVKESINKSALKSRKDLHKTVGVDIVAKETFWAKTLDGTLIKA